MSQFAVKDIDKYYNKVKYDSQLFPIKVGDEVVVKITCEVIEKEPWFSPYDCPFKTDCKNGFCFPFNECEVTTTVESIFDRGYGWRIIFAGLVVEASFVDFGTSFWKKEDKQ